jgi:hypothetical protein
MITHAHIFRWDGEAMVPLRPRLADKDFVVGMPYHLEVVEERNSKSHRHYFAALHEAWQNLPDELAERFPTSEHLRAYALIKTGFHDQRSIVASSKAETLRLAGFVRPCNEFSVVIVRDATVSIFTAKSQSTRAMGKEAFQASKTAVLDYAASLIGVKTGALQRHAETA